MFAWVCMMYAQHSLADFLSIANFHKKQVFHIMGSIWVSKKFLLVPGSHVSKQVKVQFWKRNLLVELMHVFVYFLWPLHLLLLQGRRYSASQFFCFIRPKLSCLRGFEYHLMLQYYSDVTRTGITVHFTKVDEACQSCLQCLRDIF